MFSLYSLLILNFIGMKPGIIEIEGMKFYAYHGYFESERIVGNEFVVDISIETDCSAAAASDSLEDALNYQSVYDLVKREMQVKSFLLEHVAGRILITLQTEFPNIQNARIKVSKVNPPMGGEVENASVTLFL